MFVKSIGMLSEEISIGILYKLPIQYLWCVCMLSHFHRIWLCDPKDCSPPGFSVHGDSPDKNTGMGCRTHFKGIFLTLRSNWCLLCLLHWQADSLPLAPPVKPNMYDNTLFFPRNKAAVLWVVLSLAAGHSQRSLFDRHQLHQHTIGDSMCISLSHRLPRLVSTDIHPNMQATRLKAGIQDTCSVNGEIFAAYRNPTSNLGSPCQLQPNKPTDSNYYTELGILYHYLSSMYDIRECVVILCLFYSTMNIFNVFYKPKYVDMIQLLLWKKKNSLFLFLK